MQLLDIGLYNLLRAASNVGSFTHGPALQAALKYSDEALILFSVKVAKVLQFCGTTDISKNYNKH